MSIRDEITEAGIVLEVPKENKQIVIIYGNIIDGSNVIGSFASWEEVNSFAEYYLQSDDWHATELVNPDEMKRR